MGRKIVLETAHGPATAAASSSQQQQLNQKKANVNLPELVKERFRHMLFNYKRQISAKTREGIQRVLGIKKPTRLRQSQRLVASKAAKGRTGPPPLKRRRTEERKGR